MRWMVCTALMLAGLTAAVGSAAAAVILPVDTTRAGFPPIAGAPVTLSVFQNGVDVTDTWIPTWSPGSNPTPVHVVVNSGGAPTAQASVALVPAASVSAASFTGTVNPFLTGTTLTTSAYPGQCTNHGSATDFTPDVEFSSTGVAVTTSAGTTVTGFPLTPRDCGAMAVLTVGVGSATFTFIVPQDGNANGIADSWEASFCPNNACPTGREDADAGPVTGAPTGDGIAAFDEYRGFIVSGRHVSTDPRQKDVFVHLVNGQCGAATASLLGGGATTYPTDGTSLFANLATLISNSQVHLLGFTPGATNGTTAEWVDNLASFSDVTGLVYAAGTDGAISDRQINRNAIYPLADAVTGRRIQKGLRVVECLDASRTSPFGVGGLGTPNGDNNDFLYTQRIANHINGLITAGGARRVRYFTYVNGVAQLQFTSAGAPTADDRNTIISKVIQFYLAMEVAHSTQLTPTVEGTRQTSYGYHHAPGTGSNLDQTIINKVDKSTAGFNSFYIPLHYNGVDQGSFKLRN